MPKKSPEIRTKVGALDTRKKHDTEKLKQKSRADERNHAKEKDIKQGDKIMVQQKKTSTKPPWDPDMYTVTEVKGS